MLDYFIRRLMQFIPVLFLASVLVFLIMHLAPGDPSHLLAGPDATPEDLEIIRHSLGLDRPLVLQYLYWLGQILRGNMGQSLIIKRPVLELIRLMFPATLELAVIGVLLMVVIALPVGVLGALRQGSSLDRVLSVLVAAAVAIPTFWLGIVVILIFAVYLHWLPPGARISMWTDPGQAARHLILPSVTVALHNAAILSRFVKASLLEVLGEDYIRTARSKGLRESSVIWRHALKNALIPVVTVLGIRLGRYMSGAVIVETVFSWPGVGRLIVQAIANRDYPLVQGLLLFFVTMFVGINFLTDITYGMLDPRIRLGESA